MRKLTRMVLLCTMLAMAATQATAQKWENLADTPQMGWNSWNKFQGNISEEVIKGIADAMVEEGLLEAGYTYLNIDDTWHGKRDADGFIQPDPKKFPSGMKALADYVHSKGLRWASIAMPEPRHAAVIPAHWDTSIRTQYSMPAGVLTI